MPRKGPAPKRPIVVDPVYGSPLVSQLVSKILLDGKKTTAQSIVYGALEGTRTKTGVDPEFGRGMNPYDQMFGDPSSTPYPNIGPIEKAIGSISG